MHRGQTFFFTTKFRQSKVAIRRFVVGEHCRQAIFSSWVQTRHAFQASRYIDTCEYDTITEVTICEVRTAASRAGTIEKWSVRRSRAHYSGFQGNLMCGSWRISPTDRSFDLAWSSDFVNVSISPVAESMGRVNKKPFVFWRTSEVMTFDRLHSEYN